MSTCVSSALARRRLCLLCLQCLGAALGACAPSAPTAGSGPGAATSAPQVSVPAAPRSRSALDPRLRQALAAADEGRWAEVAALLAELGPGGPLDQRLLLARLEQVRGESVASLRRIEETRALFPDDARVCATAAELYTVLGRSSAAQQELSAGLAAAGETPELLRAGALLLLSQSGGAEPALAQLERALELDPELEYTRFARQQCHLLLGRACLGSGQASAALEHARAAAALFPLRLDSRELLADALAANNDLEPACAMYEVLLSEGLEVQGTLASLHQRAALPCLIAKQRAQALAHYERALALGLPRAELGFGSNLLDEEQAARLERGIQAYERADYAAAQGDFERAVQLAPEDPLAHNHLGSALFKLQRYRAAALEWERVLELEPPGADLPVPVHLNLGRAWYLAGETELARAGLQRYLDREPEGAWASETAAMLDELARQP